MKVSPLAPPALAELPAIEGAAFATAEAAVKYRGRPDVMLAVLEPGTAIAGVFTRSATRAAPVLDCQEKIGSTAHGPAAILVNAGNANAFTGKHGSDAVTTLTSAVAAETGVEPSRIFTASTGVIGEPLPHERITAKLAELNASLSTDGMAQAAKAIMTTDTFAKASATQFCIDGQTVQIAGIAKGSGMIAPDMATMLVYIFTDAKVAQDRLQDLTSALSDKTFNCITVDSDTSTSDTLIVAATGASGVDVGDTPEFEDALYGVMLDLAHQVVKDGEGASKFITVTVSGAADDTDARKVAMSIANSPLVKTAVAGEDANWGRIVMAVGKSGAMADRDRLTIRFGDITVAENGWRAPDYSEDTAMAYMKNAELEIGVDLGIGFGQCMVWTCDLTHGYVDINADYRS